MKHGKIGSTLRYDDFEFAQQVLADRVARWTEGKDQLTTAIPDLIFHRFEKPTEPMSYMFEQSVCLIAQGAKRVLLGEAG